MGKLSEILLGISYDPRRDIFLRGDDELSLQALADFLLTITKNPRGAQDAMRFITTFHVKQYQCPPAGAVVDASGAVFGSAVGAENNEWIRLGIAFTGGDDEPPAWGRLFSGFDEQAAFAARAWLAGALLGIPTAKILFLWGAGGAGKSVLVELLMEIFGELGVAFSDATRLIDHDPYYIARLQSRRLLVISEFTKQILGAGIKALSGGDRLLARHPYGRPFEFTPRHRILITSNEPPLHSDINSAMSRRLLVVKIAPPAARDPDLLRAARSEAGSWVRWLLESYAQHADAVEQQDITDIVEKPEMSIDTAAVWIRERLSDVLAMRERVGLAEAFSDYRVFCASELGARPAPRDLFKSRLRAQGVQLNVENNHVYIESVSINE